MKSILIVNLLLLVAVKVYCGRMYEIETSRIMNTSFYQCIEAMAITGLSWLLSKSTMPSVISVFKTYTTQKVLGLL